MLFYGFYPIEPKVASLEVNSSIYWTHIASQATIEAYRASINDPLP